MNTEEHLIACLAEECAEIAKECGKAHRFGLDDQVTVNPDGPRGTEGPSNREKIIAEMNDFIGVANLLVAYGVIPATWQDSNAQRRKMAKVESFMGYAERVGALQVPEG